MFFPKEELPGITTGSPILIPVAASGQIHLCPKTSALSSKKKLVGRTYEHTIGKILFIDTNNQPASQFFTINKQGSPEHEGNDNLNKNDLRSVGTEFRTKRDSKLQKKKKNQPDC
jgi:hypothetical protein